MAEESAEEDWQLHIDRCGGPRCGVDGFGQPRPNLWLWPGPGPGDTRCKDLVYGLQLLRRRPPQDAARMVAELTATARMVSAALCDIGLAGVPPPPDHFGRQRPLAERLAASR